MKLFKSFLCVLLIALFFIGTDLFLVHQEAAVSRALKNTQPPNPMASLMTKLVKNLVEGQQTLAVYPDNNVKDILQMMEEHHLQSVPVLASKDERRIIGIVDSLDLVNMMLDKHSSNFERGELAAQTHDFWHNQTMQFHNTPVMEVIDYSKKQPVQTIHESATLRDAIDTFLLNVHRVAVVDDRSRFVGILTQSRVIEYMSSFDSTQQIPGLRSEICLKYFVTENVVKVKDSLLAWKAFRVLKEQDVTSLAVEEEHTGLFYDVMSASDIKILNKHNLDVFLKSARAFVEYRKKSDRPPVAIYSDNLAPTIDIMRTMVREKIHRVFLLREQRCSGVVSMTDILKQIAKETA